MSFAEKEQKNTRQEFSFGDDHCVTRFNFFANYSLINTEKNIHIQYSTSQYWIWLNGIFDSRKYKKQCEEIKNNDYYKYSAFKNCLNDTIAI